MRVNFFLNSEKVSLECSPLRSLLEIIRYDFRLRNTKEGCLKGECGSCLVFVDNLLINSCLKPAYQLEGKRVLTIEGFVKTKEYQDIEKAFLAKDLFSCSFCTPSLILATESLLINRPEATASEIEEYLSGYLCHFSSSQNLLDAITLAASQRRKRLGSTIVPRRRPGI